MKRDKLQTRIDNIHVDMMKDMLVTIDRNESELIRVKKELSFTSPATDYIYLRSLTDRLKELKLELLKFAGKL